MKLQLKSIRVLRNKLKVGRQQLPATAIKY